MAVRERQHGDDSMRMAVREWQYGNGSMGIGRVTRQEYRETKSEWQCRSGRISSEEKKGQSVEA